MTFLAPWALAFGAAAAAVLVTLHLVARQRPAAYSLPTARFVPDRRTLVSRASRRPRDLLLLLVRLLLVVCATLAFARPVLTPQRRARARVLVLDRSAAVADPADALRRARDVAGDGVPTQVLVFDSSVAVVGALDSLTAIAPPRTNVLGSLSAALAAARRAGAERGRTADSVELVLVSAFTEREMDAATDTIRATWPGAVRMVRVDAARDSASLPSLDRPISDADVLGPALAARAVQASAGAVRVVRGAISGSDSAFARAGGVVVRWDSIGAQRPSATALVMGDDVVVASLARRELGAEGRVLARWADGVPAAAERVLGAGCVRDAGIGVPVAGDLPLRPAFQRIVRGLTDRCAGRGVSVGAPLDSARLAALAGPTSLATGRALLGDDDRPSPSTPWLLAAALACAVLELLLRIRGGERDAA